MEFVNGYIYISWNDDYKFYGDNVFKIGRTTNIQSAQHSENKGLRNKIWTWAQYKNKIHLLMHTRANNPENKGI